MIAMTEPSTIDKPETVVPPLPETQEVPFLDGPLRPKTNVLTKVSIVIPVYNEEATVQDLVRLVVNAPLPQGVTREIIMVNDCSKDGTKAKLDELPKLCPNCHTGFLGQHGPTRPPPPGKSH